MGNSFKFLFTVSITLFLISCSSQNGELIIDEYSEVVLTKNNELQFCFKVNEKTLTNVDMYKLRISINDPRLASALGTNELVYGENSVYKGEYVEVGMDKGNILLMEPILLKKDLHTFELEKLIVSGHAVTIEIFYEEKVLAKTTLTNFSSQL